MKFNYSHIYKEGNQVADKLSMRVLKEKEFYWWNSSITEIEHIIEKEAGGVTYRRKIKS